VHGGGAVLGTQYRLPLPQPNTGLWGLFDPLASARFTHGIANSC